MQQFQDATTLIPMLYTANTSKLVKYNEQASGTGHFHTKKECAEEEKKAENVFEIEVEEKLPTRNIILIYDTEYPQSIASKEFQKFLSSQKN